jgi:hemerythrin-like domain-containing protein
MASGRGNSKARNEILEMLKEDHQRVKKAFKAAQKLDPEEDSEALQALVEETCTDIEIHARLEEELFYPAAREALKEQDLIEEAEVEHASAKMLIQQLRELSPDDPKYAATFKVLGEYIKHHVKEEETELFEQLSARTKVQWEELQQQMLALRETLMAEMGVGEEEEEEDSRSRSRSGRGSRSEQAADQEETVE